MKKILPILIVLVFLGWVVWWWNSVLSPANPKDESEKSFVVTKGQGFSQTADQLEKEGIIRSSFALKLLAKQKELSDKVQAGTFKLSPALSSYQVLDKITRSPDDMWVTLLEGWRIEEMAQKLSAELGIQSGEFLKFAREGYMFPDTYLFPKEYTGLQVAKKMRETFEQKFTPELRAKIKAQGLSEEGGVILASIVEREARSDGVRTDVASILLKRLKIGMGLNADATVQYALGYQAGEKSWWKRHLTRDNLKINSPYNTYIHAGLPPTSISNPSLSSLQAVANADPKTPYLYYYHDSKGNSHYAKTLEEHNQNVASNP